jgi:DNA-binding MurR/RpiR family transcriptional regulator
MQETASSALVATRLRELLEGRRLSPAQRQVARCVLERPDEVLFASSVELAERAGVSQPSVTRFAAALGFAGYPALRDELRSAAVADRALERAGRSTGAQTMIDAELRQLVRLREQLADELPLARAGHLLATSDPLVVCGLRVSAPLAHLFAFHAAKVVADVRLVVDGGSRADDEIERAADRGATAMLVFALPRHPRELLPLLRNARRKDMQIVLVTDQIVASLCEDATVVLAAGVTTETVFDGLTAPTALTVALLQAMFDALPVDAQRRLDAFEQSALDRNLWATA